VEKRGDGGRPSTPGSYVGLQKEGKTRKMNGKFKDPTESGESLTSDYIKEGNARPRFSGNVLNGEANMNEEKKYWGF